MARIRRSQKTGAGAGAGVGCHLGGQEHKHAAGRPMAAIPTRFEGQCQKGGCNKLSTARLANAADADDAVGHGDCDDGGDSCQVASGRPGGADGAEKNIKQNTRERARAANINKRGT